jgi:AAA domain
MKMSILQKAKTQKTGALIITILGGPGSGKTTLAATFPKPFLIRTQGESPPRDIPEKRQPVSLGETNTVDKLWQQMDALLNDEHDFKTLIVDSATGLEELFIAHVVDADPKAKGIQQAGGGYGAGRDEVSSLHLLLRKKAELLRAVRGMNTVFIAHSDIATISLPDTDQYSQYTLRMHGKSIAPYTDQVDAVGFLRQHTVFTGDGKKKRPISGEDRELVVHLTAANVSKNRLGIVEPLVVVHGRNPFAPWLDGKMPVAERPNAEALQPAPSDEPADIAATDTGVNADEFSEGEV